MRDGFGKIPDAALGCILPRLSAGQAYCGVRRVRLTPQNLTALPAKFLQSRLIFAFKVS
jgi:hypothetical protein